tara:strand:+ start:359 stop:829 length:471 start_codon:yes stop_codon:yes gene_type:complete
MVSSSNMTPNELPAIELYSHVDGEDMPVVWLKEMAEQALPHCLESKGTEDPLLSSFEEIEVSLVSDETIAQVHWEFMNDPTPTDVITFHHGEILVSAETARREGPTHGHTAQEEALLYIIHGMLHLNGHTDLVEPEREAMHRCQEKILRQVIAGGG